MNGMEEFALRFAQAAAHMLWLGALIGLAAFLVDRLWISSPAGRHGVHLLGMLAILAAFPLCFLWTDVTAPDGPDSLGERAVTEVAEEEMPRPSAVLTEEPASTEMDGASLPLPDSGLLLAEPSTDARSSDAANQGSDKDAGIWREIGPLVSGSYLLGLLIMSLRLIFGWVGSARLRKRGDSITSGLWWDSLAAIRERIRTRGEVTLAWSREVAAPVVMGFIKPAILLPMSLASRLKPEQIEAVLAHELAHLARRDTWAVLVQRVVETVLFFHPAVWWISRRMEEAREEACDDLVLAAGCDPADYAEALLICSECRLEQAGISAKLAERLAATGGYSTSLQQRVLRLLGQGESGQVRLGRAGWVLGALAATGVAMGMVLGGLTPGKKLDEKATEELKNSLSKFREDWDSTRETRKNHLEGLPAYAIVDCDRKVITIFRDGSVVRGLTSVELPKGYDYQLEYWSIEGRKFIPKGSLESPVVLRLSRPGAPRFHESVHVVGSHPKDTFSIELTPSGWGFGSSSGNRDGYDHPYKREEGSRSMVLRGEERDRVISQWNLATGRELPGISRADSSNLERWFARYQSGELSEKDFLLHVKQSGSGPHQVSGLIEYLDSGETDRLAMKAIEQFKDDPLAHAYVVEALESMAGSSKHDWTNRKHCCLVLLGQMGDETHANLIAGFLKESPYAVLPALATLGGEKAVDHLVGAFDQLREDQWGVIAQYLERAEDPAAVPELKRRLAMVEAPPSERFGNNTVPIFINAIGRLSGEEDSDSGLIVWQQGQHFVYPFDGPGSAKSFSVHPPRNHYIKMPKADAAMDAGREAIWAAFAEGTEGPGFTIDGEELVLLNGLRAMPLWPDGPPYPTTMYDWLERTSHRVLLEEAKRLAVPDRVAIPDHGHLLGLDPEGRFYGIQLERTTSDFQYNVRFRPMDPLRQLVQPSPLAKGPYTDWWGLTLHDLETERKDGALNLHRRETVALDEALFQKPGPEAVLTVDFSQGRVGIGVPGASEFLLVEANEDMAADELVRRLAKARIAPPVIDDHEIIAQDSWRAHLLDQPEPGRCFGFAIRMPDGIPVAGLLTIQSTEAEVFKGRHCFLFTRFARQVFAPAQDRFVGELSSGLRVELLGVGFVAATGRPWWRADGRRLAEDPYHRIDAGSTSPKQGHYVRELALAEHWGEVSFVRTATRWKISPCQGWGGHVGRDAEGRLMMKQEERNGETELVSKVHGILGNFPEDTVTIRREYAAGAFKERTTWSTDGSIPRTKSPSETFQLRGPVKVSNGVEVTVERVPRSHDCRLVFIDAAGAETLVNEHSSSGTLGSSTHTLKFLARKVPLADIAKIRMESRPYDQWIEFRNVSLRPGVKRKVEVVTSDMEGSAGADVAVRKKAYYEDDPRETFLKIERFARLPKDRQAEGLRDFYEGMPSGVMSPFAEMALSSTPHDLLDPNAEGDAYDGNTFLWAEQLESAVSDLNPEEVAEKLGNGIWLRVAARARALGVFRNHLGLTRKLVEEGLESPNKESLGRAGALIQGLSLKGYTEPLMKRWLADDECSEVAYGTLMFGADPNLTELLMVEARKDPDFLLRGSGLLQAGFAGQPTDSLLLGLLDPASPTYDRELAYHAASAMRYCVDGRLSETISRFADDEENRFRELAAEMARSLPEEDFLRIRASLLPLLRDDVLNIRGIALRAFSEKRDPSTGPVIVDALTRRQTDEGFKVAVMQAMSALTGKGTRYDMHEWGMDSKNNREALASFEAWLAEAKAASEE